MGFASYVEDIIERIGFDLSTVEDAASKERVESIASGSTLRLEALVDACKCLLHEIHLCLDLATDPQVDLASEVVSLRHRNAYLAQTAEDLNTLKQELKAARKRCSELEQELVHSSIKYGGKAADVKEIGRRYKRLEKKYSMLRKRSGLH